MAINFLMGIVYVKIVDLNRVLTDGSSAPKTAFGSSDLHSSNGIPTIESHPVAKGVIVAWGVGFGKLGRFPCVSVAGFQNHREVVDGVTTGRGSP